MVPGPLGLLTVNRCPQGGHWEGMGELGNCLRSGLVGLDWMSLAIFSSLNDSVSPQFLHNPQHIQIQGLASGSSAPCGACPVPWLGPLPFQGLLVWAQVPNCYLGPWVYVTWGPGCSSWCLASSWERSLPSYSWPQKLITDAPASTPIPVDRESAGGSNGSERLLVEAAMEAGAGGAVVSASTGARTASAQG